MRLRWLCLCAVLATARLAKVVETLENLGKSLRQESKSTTAEFEETKKNCSEETNARQASAAALNETLSVLVSAAEAAEAKMASLDQALTEKKMELGQVEDLATAEKDALAKVRESYETEHAALDESKQELEKQVKESKDMALAATGSLKQLRKLDSALTQETAETRETKTVSFLQMDAREARRGDLEDSLDKVRQELEDLRQDFDAKVAEHQARIDELHEQVLPLERDVAKLVPARANAEAEKTGAEAQKTDLERTTQRAAAALQAHADLCAASLGAFSSDAELRAEVQNALAGAAETLQSSVFTSLVERSAAALDIPLSFVQVSQEPTVEPAVAQVLLQMQTQTQVQVATTATARAGILSAATDPFADVKARIRSLIDALRAQRNGDMDLATYCAEQEKTAERDNAMTKDDVDVQEATIQLHQSMEADCTANRDAAQASLAEEIARTQNAIVNAAVAAQGAKARAKDHELAKEVVAEAQTLVRELFGVAQEAGAFLQATPSQAGQQAAADQALKEIATAEKGLKSLIDAQAAAETELSGKVDAVRSAGKKVQEAMQQQVNSLEVQLSGHADARLEAETAKKNAEASLEAMDATKEEQRTQCMQANTNQQDSMQRRQEEIASLQDAVKVLDGESVPVGSSLLTKRSQGGKLSPLDAAAYAMGIAVRPS